MFQWIWFHLFAMMFLNFYGQSCLCCLFILSAVVPHKAVVYCLRLLIVPESFEFKIVGKNNFAYPLFRKEMKNYCFRFKFFCVFFTLVAVSVVSFIFIGSWLFALLTCIVLLCYFVNKNLKQPYNVIITSNLLLFFRLSNFNWIACVMDDF